MASPKPTPITVTLPSLQTNTIPLPTLESAFGPSSLGILLVSDLPPTYPLLRARLLTYSSRLANLPAPQLEKLEDPESKYNIGWSCGKEKLKEGYDVLKGSFYAHPVRSADGGLEARGRKAYPGLREMVGENIWPEGEGEMEGFRETMEELCRLVVEVAALVARACDRFGEARVEGYRKEEGGLLEGMVRGSVSTKARLLHYFPPPPAAVEGEDGEAEDDDWCATHTDLGALTGLTSQMFVDEYAHPPTSSKDETLPELDAHPDPQAGLWIHSRSGEKTLVQIPRDCLAFQTGLALERITKGQFKAVPHFVRGGKGSGGAGIARNTLAVFTQPNLWDAVDEETGMDFAGLAAEVLGKTI